ncbi:putative separase [Helianthus anomalus]
MLIGESESQKHRYTVKSIHMRPSVATAWSNAKDISYLDFILTPWNVLSCYLESLLQLGTIKDIARTGSKVEDVLSRGKGFSILQSLPIFHR